MNKAIIKPTVGRNLWFWPAPGDMEIMQHAAREGEEGPQPLHAHILYVHDDRHVALEVVDHIGNRHTRGDVVLYQEGEEPDTGGEFCFWMPYQQGQAAKEASSQASFSAGSGSVGAVGGLSGTSSSAGIDQSQQGAQLSSGSASS